MFIDPVLAVRLTSMGMSENNVGYAFAIIGFSFGFGSPITGLLCEKFSRLVVMQFGLVMVSFAIMLVGPSIILGLPNVIWVMLVGIFFLGFFASMLYVPVTPEIIEATAIHQKANWTRALR